MQIRCCLFPEISSQVRNILECLSDVFKKLPQCLSPSQRSYVYQVYILCHLLIQRGLNNPNVSVYFKKILKIQRTKAFNLCPLLFKAFQNHEFAKSELDVLFNLVFEPYLTEGYKGDENTLLAIIRAFNGICDIPRYFGLLNRPFGFGIEHRTPMTIMVDYLFSPESARTNQSEVVEALLKLFQDYNLDYLPLPEIPQEDLQSDDKTLSLGTRIVVNHAERLLNYLRNTLPNEIRSSSKATMLSLSLLEKISEFVQDSSLGSEFSLTLLKFVELGHLKNEQSLISVLTSVSKFVKREENPEEIFRIIVSFLSNLKGRKARAALVELETSLRNNNNLSKPLQHHLKRLEGLESWDKNRIDEPDYEQRHQCIVELNQKLEEPEKKLSFLALLAYTHELTYNLMNVDEISLRAAVSNTLALIATFAKENRHLKSNEKITLLYDHLIVMIQRIIRSPNESVRHEGVSLLAYCIDLFGNNEDEGRDLLRHLKILRDPEDKDKCFFENVVHLQMHRRQKAFNRLAVQLEQTEVNIPLDVLERFIVPLVRPYLLVIESKLSTLSDEAIHIYAQIVRLQPWTRYLQTLGKYISQINKKEEQNTKPAIRVLSAILNQFRFNVKDVKLPRSEYQVTRHKAKREKVGAAYQKAAKGKKETEENEKSEVFEQPPNLMELDKGNGQLDESQKILATVIRVLIPKLRECIQPPTEFHAHKKAQNADNYHTDQEEILRAPLAVTTVKLLQKLPKWAMDMHLNGVILTMFKLLLSRSYLVRQAARKAMEQIVQALGPRLLPRIINELRKKFTRGFQVHVMTFTVHSMISCLQDSLKPGDLNLCLNDIFEVVKEQCFGETITDERQLQTVKANTPEAKSNRAYDTFILLGRYITVDVLENLIEPMKKIIDDFPNAQTQKKLSEMLRNLSVGLKRNTGVEVDSVLQFTSSFLKVHLTEMCRQSDALRAAELKEERERENGYRPQNCLLLAPEPKRLGVIVKTSTKSKMAIFVEFSLQLFSDILVEKKDVFEENEAQKKINEFVPLVTDALRLKYEKITSVALRSLHSLFRYDLPAINDEMAKIVDRLFILLVEYANSMGTSQLNVAELNLILFKCFVTVIRKAPKDLLTTKRIKILLNHVEMDVLDSHRQTTAFILAKAIISRHLMDDKIEEIIKYFAELSVTSPIEYIREQCRVVIHHYLKIHPNGPRSAEGWLKFYLEQIDYDLVHGRLSALEMVHTIFELFTDAVTDKFGFPTFVKLASRFASEDNVECLRYLRAAMKEIIGSVSEKTRNDIYLSCKDWLSQPKDAIKSIGAISLIEFIKTPEVKLNQSRISEIINILKGEFSKAKAEDNGDEGEEESLEEDEEKSENEKEEEGNAVEPCLNLFTDLIRVYLEQVKKALSKKNDLQKTIINGITQFLQYRNEPIQVTASILFEHLMAASESLWPMFKIHADFSKLCNALIFQLRSKNLSETMAEQAIKNLATLASNLVDKHYEELCHKLAGVVRLELKKEDTITKRISVFKFIAAQLAIYSPDTVNFAAIQQHLLGFLFREILGKSKANEILQNISNELAVFLREKLGATLYSKLLGEFQVEYGKKMTQRRQERKEMIIQNPELAIKRKQKVNKKKSVAKKRKLDELRPHRITKRKRREEITQTGDY
ncbi:unnamed protein product [Bursaphelenchus xylophilus]|uniref:(pine wood nematode) hypothetical protein n=1 Tax=Bursaphelenchus xylophilus TaxID=6326 RepID=A0A1I7RQ92_BURXY|nr:unnamed protein product [Bursaphelenchus xylophilus]CAG9097336.1 unnamed protein product [Bursaphelenchus xylophilus]